jgi:hypothetical protein
MTASGPFKIILLAWLAVGPVSARAVDLTKVDRTIAREPDYQTKTPRYCLVVFGAEAKARMWLVVDGKVLYVDRKGDGDLTGAGKRVELNPKNNNEFDIGPLSLAGGKYEYTEFKVRIKDHGRIEMFLERKAALGHRKNYGKESLTQMAGFTGISSRSWMDRDNIEEYRFQFADRPKDAPIVHFDGPLTLKPVFGKQVLERGDERTRFPVMLGTPGLGKGTFTQINFWVGDPDGEAEIAFPPRDPKGKPIVVKVALKSPD